MASQLGQRLKQTVRLIPVLRQVPLSQLGGRIIHAVRWRLRRLRNRMTGNAVAQNRVRLTDKLSGTSKGNEAFEKSGLFSSLTAVEARLFTLFEAGESEALREFIGHALLQSPGAVITMFLARSAISRELVAELLRDPETFNQLANRAAQSLQFRAGLSAAAAFILEPDELLDLQERLSGPNLRQNANAALLIDSFSTSLSARPCVFSGTVASAISRKPARHRLIIANNLNNLTRLSLLFAGAENVSLFSPSNLYGRLTLTDEVKLHARPEKLVIAHPRSRATRFSAAYHELHEETRLLAEEVMQGIREQSDGRLDEALPYLALGLADAVFFKALPIIGLKALMADPEVDQILIVSPDTPDPNYATLFMGIEGLVDDPRVEMVSLSASERTRVEVTKSFATAFQRLPQPVQTSAALARPLLAGLDALRAEVITSGGGLTAWPIDTDMEGRPKVLFVTTADSAYNSASATYADILNRNFNLMMGMVGSNPFAIFKSVPGILPPSPSRLQMLSTTTNKDLSFLEYTLRHILESVGARHAQGGGSFVAAHVLQAESAKLARAPLVNALFHWERLLLWLGKMNEAETRPDLMVLSPLRPTMVGLAAAAARRFRIPSLALEPHIINAEYCRYTRVMTDRYGTVSSYLGDLARNGFSISKDRIDVIGSPRLIAKPSVSPDTARQTLEERGLAHFPEGRQTLVFFSQPSNWGQISEVWQTILAAMKPHEQMQILLKTHPEEGELRISSYLAIAQDMGLSDRVQSVKAAPPTLIEAADLVLACYSATMVEAALAGRPVISVINKGGRYPMEQHKVVGAPQYQDEAELSAALGEFGADPGRSIARLERFLEDNPQFVTGPEPHLVAAIKALVASDPEKVLRPATDLPPRLFIEGPYRVYDV